MSYPNTDELEAQRQILGRLGQLAALASRTDALFEKATEALVEHPKTGPATKVVLILLTRLSCDMRVCGMASSAGYCLQAMGLAASMMEILGTLAYVGESNERAAEWAKHADRRQSYPRKVRLGIDATATALGIPDQAAKDDWLKAYEFMCMAKHANPLLSMRQGLADLPSGLYHVFGPDTTALGIFLSAEAINRAVGYSTAAVYIAAPLCSDEASRIFLRKEALSIRVGALSLEPLFQSLGASANAVAEPAGGANGSQPRRSDTNSTPSSAGSRRSP
jgi:hypothetical protein